MSWSLYIQRARSSDYGEIITVPKYAVGPVPPGFEASPLSLPRGAENVYREMRETDTLQLREYDDHYTLQRDKYHPRYNPIGHAVADAPKFTLAVALLGAVVLGGS